MHCDFCLVLIGLHVWDELLNVEDFLSRHVYLLDIQTIKVYLKYPYAMDVITKPVCTYFKFICGINKPIKQTVTNSYSIAFIVGLKSIQRILEH